MKRNGIEREGRKGGSRRGDEIESRGMKLLLVMEYNETIATNGRWLYIATDRSHCP
jgi:hypothetical protein